jgi:hypothetical protein
MEVGHGQNWGCSAKEKKLQGKQFLILLCDSSYVTFITTDLRLKLCNKVTETCKTVKNMHLEK